MHPSCRFIGKYFVQSAHCIRKSYVIYSHTVKPKEVLAAHADKPVYIANEDDTIRVDARSFLGLFALDYSRPMKVVTDSLYVVRMLEIQARAREAAVAHA